MYIYIRCNIIFTFWVLNLTQGMRQMEGTDCLLALVISEAIKTLKILPNIYLRLLFINLCDIQLAYLVLYNKRIKLIMWWSVPV